MRRRPGVARGLVTATAGLVLLGGCMSSPDSSPTPANEAPDIPGESPSERPEVARDVACDRLDTGFTDAPARSAEATLGGPAGEDAFTARCVWSDAETEDSSDSVDLDTAVDLPGTLSALAVGSAETSFAQLREGARADAEADGATTVSATTDELALVRTGGEVVHAEVMLPASWGYVSCSWTVAAPPGPDEPVEVVGSLCRDFRDLAEQTRTDAVTARGR